ncbi:hypothetical protein I305_02021 [Cryptococcus gattii E566]|uniref:Uncharacterized protein n=2 Tax=Cryptococcus gattii TaxID=37769 RepID=E6R4I6_CRYGW|nr:Hypothetical protein CGB_D7110C [Cryptococcus gattii WM276]ADV22066.1 Hypothetical protein CGB_D7110C [Cryptococcus gattii WM276]KIR80393.1 hypothetical protein I306_02369 [Cryptococcus gattii EJB2]KIY35768.1 hypothetical protein I305_02021 [Cryptococcus gattii E566]KJE00035.1 hypothetical protein I311_06356 [Cryptococcus gattii NT-10]
MFRPAVARPAASLARAPARSFVSRATFVGRLGTAPEKSTTSAGQPYYKYPLAVSKPPKRDADGSKSPPRVTPPSVPRHPLTTRRGHPRRRRLSLPAQTPSVLTPRGSPSSTSTSAPRPGSSLSCLAPCSMSKVPNIDTITSPAAADGAPGTKQYVFREVSHKVLSKPRQE